MCPWGLFAAVMAHLSDKEKGPLSRPSFGKDLGDQKSFATVTPNVRGG